MSANIFSAICVSMARCQKVLTLMSAAIGAVDAIRWIIAVAESERKGEPMVELREYPQEEYERDMKALLTEKGLSGAMKVYTDKINEEVADTCYVTHRTVQEYLCDILFLAQEAERRSGG